MHTVAFFIAAMLALSFGVHAAGEVQPQARAQVLLICDENNGRPRLEELIRACGKSVDSLSQAQYEATLLQDYDYLVTTVNRPYRDAVQAGIPTVCIGADAGPVDGVYTVSLQNTQLRLKLGEHTQTTFVQSAAVAVEPPSGEVYGKLELQSGVSYPFAVMGPDAAYVPWYQDEGLGIVMLGGLLQRYFADTDAGDGQMYVLLDEIYAFSDLGMLRRAADRFFENGIPFIVRIMPLYDNLDYPAFHRFTQALRYAQAKGGSVVLHDPIIRQYEAEREPLETRLARAEQAFADAGVTLLEMRRPPLCISFDDIRGIEHGKRNFGALPVDTMLRYRLFETEDELDMAIRELNDAWLSLASYKTRFGYEDPVYDKADLPDTEYVYRKAEETSLTGFFTGANKILLVLISISTVIFTLLLSNSRRIYKRKFYKR